MPSQTTRATPTSTARTIVERRLLSMLSIIGDDPPKSKWRRDHGARGRAGGDARPGLARPRALARRTAAVRGVPTRRAGLERAPGRLGPEPRQPAGAGPPGALVDVPARARRRLRRDRADHEPRPGPDGAHR